MKLKIHTLIIGAGYAGLILQHEIVKRGIGQSIIVDEGYSHNLIKNNYVVLLKKEHDFASGEIGISIKKTSSGAADFDTEYTKKVYNKQCNITTFSQNAAHTHGFVIDSAILSSNSHVYGNIKITRIDSIRKIAYGKIHHLNKDVEIAYCNLVSTIPIFELAKVLGIELFRVFSIFISYFPIGIKISNALVKNSIMEIEYYSDRNIPFYRKQNFNGLIYYEYCLNKTYKDRFTTIITPGKFLALHDDTILQLYEHLSSQNIFLVGRYSCWHPDFLLDHIAQSAESNNEPFTHLINNMYEAIENA